MDVQKPLAVPIACHQEREGRHDVESFGQIMRERGEPEPEPPTWQQLEEQEERLDMLREAEEEAMRELEENPDAMEEFEDHPLVTRCSDLAVRLDQDAHSAGWLPCR